MDYFQTPTSSLAPHIMNSHIPKLERIVRECFDVAFFLCNSELCEFGFSKVFDIFNQLITTAFIMDTGYWAFYNTTGRQCLCVCGRYALYCRHVKNSFHWIDMEDVPSDETATKFYPRYFGCIVPTDYNFTIQPSYETFEYNITCHMSLEYKRLSRGRPRRCDKELDYIDPSVGKRKYNEVIFAKYKLKREMYGSPYYVVVFQPNPFFHNYFASYFKQLLHFRAKFLNLEEKALNVEVYKTTTSLILMDVNVPLYHVHHKSYAVLPQLDDLKPYKINRSRKPKPESLVILSPPTHQFSQFTVEEPPVQNFIVPTDSLPVLQIDEAVDFDSQIPRYGYQKQIQKPVLPPFETNFHFRPPPPPYPVSPIMTPPEDGIYHQNLFPLPSTSASSPLNTVMAVPAEVIGNPDMSRSQTMMMEFDHQYAKVRAKAEEIKEKNDLEMDLIQECIVEDLLSDDQNKKFRRPQ